MTITLKKTILYFLDLFYIPFKKWLPYPVYSYLGVGAINTVLNIVLFILLYQFVLPSSGITICGQPIASYTLALIIAFLITVPTGFWLNRNFAFIQVSSAPKQTSQQMIKYFLVVLQGLVSDYLILKALVLLGGINPSVSKVISTFIVLTMNYLLQKYYTFKAKA